MSEREMRLVEAATEALELFERSVAFSGGRDGDQCHWCRRDEYFEQGATLEEQHNTDCAYLLWHQRTQSALAREAEKTVETHPHA